MKVLNAEQQSELDTLTDDKINKTINESDYETFKEEEILVNNARQEAEDEFLTLYPELI
jgi:hypothetical protein